MTQDLRQRRLILRGHSDDRRVGGDRRLRPTPMFSRFTLHGRRTRYRRDTDLLRGKYVDRSTGRHLVLILVLMICVIIDAASTLYILDNGGTEANPIMNSALQRGVGWFLAIKLGPLPVAFLLLSIHRYFPWVRGALFFLVTVYGLLALYHGYLLLRILI